MATRTLLAATLLCSAAFAQRLEILSATYGAGIHTADLTNRVRSLVSNDTLALTVDTPTLGEDPAPGQQKALHVRYKYDGKESLVSAVDFGTIRIPAKSGFSIADLAVDRGTAVAPAPGAVAIPAAPSAPVASPAPATSGLRIVEAQYGWRDRQNDVRTRVESMVRDGRASFRVDNQPLGGDPAVGKDKTLRVVYETGGRTYEITQREGRTINIPDSSAKMTGAAAAPVAPAPLSSAPPAAFDNGRPAALRVFSARYVRGSESIDVRARVASMAANDRLDVRVDPGSLGAGGGGGYLVVRYEFKGRTFEKSGGDGQTLSLP